MSYDKLRYLEQLLNNIYKDGLKKHKSKIETYFQTNYGKDSLCKPVPVQTKIKTKKKLTFPKDLDRKIEDAGKRVFGGK
tara:strand:+ start:624 stop:860 length:237 start_codon:yes stop_codon:yes gene_type:complete